jgi:N-acetylglucosaminyl-diphospho-decaprenol L-rhamnosyltransferase
MILSIIIVNYNVKYFLEQCLCSVVKAITGIEAEVFVVDNNSPDDSLSYLKPKFSSVQFINNTDNPGFGKANNQALGLAKGKYILFLNPDTIIGEDSFATCIRFLENHPHAGATGVYMIDGSGSYLKESKRGFTSPWVSFCKLSGLTSFFPHSKLFAGYYLGHLNENENNEVDVLSGACMMVKKEVLDNTGGFDEQFFMYAEDIDLCFRIQKAGYKNYSLAETTIIHFKGESTLKDIRYTKLFYRAMSQFTRKHFSSGFSVVFTLLMSAAIWFRAMLSAVGHLIKPAAPKKQQAVVTEFLAGDKTTMEALRLNLTGKRKITTTKNEATEIIFCEGTHFSFKEIVRCFKEKKDTLTYMIHAASSQSVVGSNSKEVMGETISL